MQKVTILLEMSALIPKIIFATFDFIHLNIYKMIITYYIVNQIKLNIDELNAKHPNHILTESLRSQFLALKCELNKLNGNYEILVNCDLNKISYLRLAE